MNRLSAAFVAAFVLIAAVPVSAAPPAKPKYVVILRSPRAADMKPHGGGTEKLSEPDFKGLGASVVEQWGRYRVIAVAPEALPALLHNPAVETVQRVFTGESLPDPVPATASLHPASAGLHGASDASWDSGTYQYDGAGNIKAIDTRTYNYDTAGRLVKYAKDDNTVETYSYDSFGNLTEKVTNGETLSIPADPETNRLQGVQYDLNGNTIENGIDTFQFDQLNMMQQRQSGAPLEQHYFYTADDERIAMYDGNEWHVTVRDFSNQPIREWTARDMVQPGYAPTWVWIEDHIYRDGQLLAAERDPAQGGTRHFHLDHLGTPRLITDQVGTSTYQLAQHDYFPFGVEETSTVQEQSNFGFDREEPHHFTGHERDSAEGNILTAGNADYLDYMHARYYSPGLGRFLSVDPGSVDLGEPQSWNRYAYVRNNPIGSSDPDGREDRSKILRPKPLPPGAAREAVQKIDQLLTRGANVAMDVVAIADIIAMIPETGDMELVQPEIEKLETDAVVEGESVEISTKTYQTYTKTNPDTNEVYSGRTSGTGTPEQNVARRDAGHHMNDKGFGPSVLDKSSPNASAIRGREQQLIDANGGAKSQGGTSGNAINGVSPNNPNRDKYIDDANREFKP